MKFSLSFRQVVAFLFLASAAFGIPLAVAGQDSEAQKNAERKIVAVNEVIDGDYTAAGETVEISGTVNGDVYVVGGQVLVNGEINGDLLAVGATISISGTVSQNVRVLGGQVVISGNVGRNVTIGGMNIELTSAADIKGGVVIGGANVVLAAPIGKDVKVGGRNLTIANTIKGNVEAAVEGVRLTSKALVQGDLTYWSNRAASIDEASTVEGTVTRKAPQTYSLGKGKAVNDVLMFLQPVLAVVSFLTTLVFGLLLIRFFPEYTKATVFTVRNRRWRSLTSGVTAFLVIPILFGLLIITIVGIPLGFILLTLSSLILYVARIFVMIAIGAFILERFGRNMNDYWTFVGGLVVYSLLVLIPVVGWVISLLAALFGVGAALQTLKERVSKDKKTFS